MLFAMVGLSSGYSQKTNIDSGLVAYFPFNGSTNDESGNGNNGIRYGASLSIDRFGVANKSYSFNGTSNYIEVPDNPTLRFNNSFSISLWASLTNPYPLNYNMTLIDKSLGSTYPDSYAIYTGHWTGGDTAVDAGYCNNSTCIGNDNVFTLKLNTWYNIQWIFDKTLNIESFFINGNLINSQPISGIIEYDSNPLAIGRGLLYGSYAEFFGGKLDDIRLYNRALTDAEIQQLYHEGGWVSIPSYINYDFNIELYPNPTTEKVYIKSTKIVQLKVYDFVGKLLFTGNTNNCNEVTLKQKGIYLLELTSDNNTVYKKVVVQ